MVRAKYGFSGGCAASVAGAALAFFGSVGIAACSSSSGGGTTVDSGDDSSSYVTPETGAGGDGASSGGGGSDASDAPSCNIPASATYNYDASTGGFACLPIGPDPMCDSKSYLLRCIATDPSNTPPDGSLSFLNCGNKMLTSMSIETEFCCACK
jgi:hypothetical protein